MESVDINLFRNEVLSILDENTDAITNLKITADKSVITFTGKHYSCTVKIDDKWIGYELEILTKDGNTNCYLQSNTDLYPLNGIGYEEVTKQTYKGLKHTIQSIFEGAILYSSMGTFLYIAVKNIDSTYEVHIWKRKKFLGFNYTSGEKKIMSQDEVRNLNLAVLT